MIIEYMISLSINMLLLGSGIMLILTGTKDYIYEIGDWDMVSEIRMSLGQISDKVRYGNKIMCDGSDLWIIFYDKPAHIIYRDEYYLKNNENDGEGYILHKQYDAEAVTATGQPLTGDSFIGKVVINKLNFTKSDEHTLKIKIEGVNKLSGHTISLETNIFCYGEFVAEGG